MPKVVYETVLFSSVFPAFHAISTPFVRLWHDDTKYLPGRNCKVGTPSVFVCQPINEFRQPPRRGACNAFSEQDALGCGLGKVPVDGAKQHAALIYQDSRWRVVFIKYIIGDIFGYVLQFAG